MENLRIKLAEVFNQSDLPLEAKCFVVQSFARQVGYEYTIASLKLEAQQREKETKEDTEK